MITTRNNIEAIRKNLTTLIISAKIARGGPKSQPIINDFKQRYFYGNFKSHKINNPFIPIVSQVPSPTYRLTKHLIELFRPYISTTYSPQATNEFIDDVGIKNPYGVMPPSDSERLFINELVRRTL